MIMPPDPARFGQLLREKMDELDAAEQAEESLLSDEVERLRLDAAVLATRGEPRLWVVGAQRKYQSELVGSVEQKPSLDICFPIARQSAPSSRQAEAENNGRMSTHPAAARPSQKQVGRVPKTGTI